MSEVLHVSGHPVRLTHPEKVFWPAGGAEPATTKADLVTYLAAVAGPLLAQLADRPLSRVRWPHGVGGEHFVEKNAPAGAPEWLRTVLVRGTGSRGGPGSVRHPVVEDLAGLVWAAQLGALELHAPQWRVGPRGARAHPDRLVLDLDPGPGTGLEECAAIAHVLAQRLADDGLAAVPVTSGSSGLHLYAPLAGTQDADVVRAYARALAESLARDHPGVTAVMTRSVRAGRVLLDWSQNSAAKTTAVPYSPRGRPGSPAAAPRRWSEVGPGLAQLSMREVAARVAADGDLMAPVASPGPQVPVR